MRNILIFFIFRKRIGKKVGDWLAPCPGGREGAFGERKITVRDKNLTSYDICTWQILILWYNRGEKTGRVRRLGKAALFWRFLQFWFLYKKFTGRDKGWRCAEEPFAPPALYFFRKSIPFWKPSGLLIPPWKRMISSCFDWSDRAIFLFFGFSEGILFRKSDGLLLLIQNFLISSRLIGLNGAIFLFSGLRESMLFRKRRRPGSISAFNAGSAAGPPKATGRSALSGLGLQTLFSKAAQSFRKIIQFWAGFYCRKKSIPGKFHLFDFWYI